jgi:hypothetical protein
MFFLDIDALASNISHTAAVSIVGAYIKLEVFRAYRREGRGNQDSAVGTSPQLPCFSEVGISIND